MYVWELGVGGNGNERSKGAKIKRVEKQQTREPSVKCRDQSWVMIVSLLHKHISLFFIGVYIVGSR